MGNELWNMRTITERYHFVRIVNVRANVIIQAIVSVFINGFFIIARNNGLTHLK